MMMVMMMMMLTVDNHINHLRLCALDMMIMMARDHDGDDGDDNDADCDVYDDSWAVEVGSRFVRRTLRRCFRECISKRVWPPQTHLFTALLNLPSSPTKQKGDGYSGPCDRLRQSRAAQCLTYCFLFYCMFSDSREPYEQNTKQDK